MTVLIVKNCSREGPGLLGDMLQECHIDHEVVDLDQGQSFPDPKVYKALVVFGGPDSANDATPKMQQELQRIKEAVEAGIPFLGACLGLQVLVKAHGGRVYPQDVKEIGWKDPWGNFFRVELTAEGKKDPLFSGIKASLPIFHLHGETVSLTKEMALLATGKYCQNQIVRVGDHAYGIQGHFELTPSLFEEWIHQDPDLLRLDKASLLRDFEEVKQEYQRIGREFLTNFLKLAGLIPQKQGV